MNNIKNNHASTNNFINIFTNMTLWPNKNLILYVTIYFYERSPHYKN